MSSSPWALLSERSGVKRDTLDKYFVYCRTQSIDFDVADLLIIKSWGIPMSSPSLWAEYPELEKWYTEVDLSASTSRPVSLTGDASRVCAYDGCDLEFTPLSHHRQKYCSRGCKAKAWNQQRRAAAQRAAA